MASSGPRLLDQLPQKDRVAFKAVHKLYDDRKYGKAAKGIDTLMKKHPMCIEFLSMKALILRNIPERKAEGLASVKQALRLNIRSATAWHVLGSFHKMESNFSEALKSYKQAVKCDPTDIHLLRDLSFLQLFLQMWPEFLETRRQILAVSGDTKAHWYALPFALHLAGQPAEAADELIKWWSLKPEHVGDVAPIVDSELRLYLVRLLEEAGQWDRALSHCQASLETGLLKTTSAMLTKQGRIQLRMNMQSEARETYWRLLQLLPENMDYVFGHFISSPASDGVLTSPFEKETPLTIPFALYPSILTDDGAPSADWIHEPLIYVLAPHQELCTLDEWGRRAELTGRTLALNCGDTWRTLYALKTIDISAEQERQVIAYCDDLLKNIDLKTCESLEYFPLAFIRSEENFKAIVHKNLSKKILKLSASTFKTMEILLEVPDDRRRWITEVLRDIQRSIESEADQMDTVLPAVLVKSLLCFHDIHYTTERSEALARLDQLRKDVPTYIELGTMLRDALELEGDVQSAAEVAEELMHQDEADRYLNDLCVKSLFKAGRIQEGLEIAKIFTRQSEGSKSSTDQQESRLDMQHMEFELALASGYESLGVWDRAANRYHYLLKRYQIMKEESVDFYFYCLRRAALSSLVDYIYLVNKIEQHRYFSKAAVKLIDLHFRKHDGLLIVPATLPTLPSSKDEPVLDVTFDFSKVEDNLTEVESILARAKLNGELRDVQLLQRSYLLYTREEKFNPSEVRQSLQGIWNLTRKNVYHPELLPYLLHFLCCPTLYDPNKEDESYDLIHSTFEMGAIDATTFAKDAIARLKASPYTTDQIQGNDLVHTSYLLSTDLFAGLHAQFLLKTSTRLRRGSVVYYGGDDFTEIAFENLDPRWNLSADLCTARKRCQSIIEDARSIISQSF